MRIRFHTLFLLFSVLFAIGSGWSIVSCLFTICASVFVLADVIPKIWRYYHASKMKSVKPGSSLFRHSQNYPVFHAARSQELEVRNDGRVSTMIKLADALGVSLDELCRDPDDSDDGEPV